MLSIKKPLNKINEIYLLVHPYFNILRESLLEDYHEMYKKSIKDASKKRECYCVVATSFFSISKKHKRKLENFVNKQFKNRNFFRESGKWFGTQFFWDEKLNDLIKNPAETTINSRGIYTQRCLYEALEQITRLYEIPEKNTFIDLRESIDAERDYSLKDIRKEKSFITFKELDRELRKEKED